VTPTGAWEPATREHSRVAGGTVDVTTKIVIAGGGFAGLYAAMHLDRTLARRREADVVLISRENFSVFTPMLHEVAAGDLQPSDIVNPLRRILRHVKVVAAEVDAIDLRARTVSCAGGISNVRREFGFDHLLLTLGAETNFFDMAGVRDWAATMKSLGDAALLHNTMVALLETAALQEDASARRPLLTFVIAGGGLAGVETTGAVNDFVNEAALHYPSVAQADIRVVLIHPESFLLPELGEELGRYAERKLRERNVDVVTGVRVTSYDGSLVTLSDGTSIPAATLIWTAGVKPSAVIASLPCETERGRVRVDEYLAVPGVSGLWAAEHRGRDRRPRAEAVSVQSDGTPGQHRAPHRCGHGVRRQVFRVHRVVSLADGLPGEASRARQEAQSDAWLDAGSVLRTRNRADDHATRRRTADRSGRAISR
jgi:NADH:quinone reductase (non-electrogenic)